MNMSILAILISLAMMLTGVGGEGQPAEASRTLVLHNVSITYNGETVDLAPELRLGASTDGQKAVFDLGVDLNGETLFPIQLGAADNGFTCLLEGADLAVNVSADALNALSEQMQQMMQSGMDSADEQSKQLMGFLTDEFIPAYTGLIEAMEDPEFMKEMEAKGNEIFAQIVDRGEGTPVTESIDGTDYALTEYSYTIDRDQMAELADQLYTANDALNNYYQCMFKMYDMMPEESGMRGMHSYKDLFDKFNLDMTMECVEKLSDDGEVDLMDAMLTFDLTGMVQAMAEAEQTADATEEADAEAGEDEADVAEAAPTELPEIPPIVMDIQSVKVGDVKDAAVSCNFEIADEDVGMTMDVTAHSEGLENVIMNMEMNLEQAGEHIGGMTMSLTAHTNEAGDQLLNLGYDIDAEDVQVSFNVDGKAAADGTGKGSFAIDASQGENSFALSFDLDVLGDAIEDKVTGHEANLSIGDLSEEGLNALTADQGFQTAMMQAIGSLSADAQKLNEDESVQQLMALFAATEESVEEDDDYVEEEDYDYSEPEDDGELGYEVPEFTWLPDGWEVQETNVDTQYDWVDISISTDDYSQSLNATFYKDENSASINYVVGGDGEIEAVDGREFSVSDIGDGLVSVTLHEGNIIANMLFNGDNIDVETIGKIIANMQF